jgi:hypothetical protein
MEIHYSFLISGINLDFEVHASSHEMNSELDGRCLHINYVLPGIARSSLPKYIFHYPSFARLHIRWPAQSITALIHDHTQMTEERNQIRQALTTPSANDRLS